MIHSNPNGDFPNIDPSAHIDPSAVVIGKVKIGKDVFVAPGAVIRADEQNSSITIGDSCNVQDRVIIHALGRSEVRIGARTSLSHGCIVHGPCRIGKDCFVGFGSIVFNASLAKGVFVQFSAVISGVDIPQGRFVCDGQIVNTKQKANALRVNKKNCENFAQRVIKANRALLKGYKQEGTNGK